MEEERKAELVEKNHCKLFTDADNIIDKIKGKPQNYRN